MNCVGIDVSKGKSMIAVMRPCGEVVVSPFEVLHTDSELSKLAGLLKSLDGETRVVMESTGNYHAPVAWLLHDAGLYVSVVNAILVHDYGNNSLRRAKTDKKDAVKLANYGLDHWLTLPRYVQQGDQVVLQHGLYFGILLVLPVAGLQHEPGILIGDISRQCEPVVKAVVGQLHSILLVGLGPP